MGAVTLAPKLRSREMLFVAQLLSLHPPSSVHITFQALLSLPHPTLGCQCPQRCMVWRKYILPFPRSVSSHGAEDRTQRGRLGPAAPLPPIPACVACKLFGAVTVLGVCAAGAQDTRRGGAERPGDRGNQGCLSQHGRGVWSLGCCPGRGSSWNASFLINPEPCPLPGA